MHLLEFLEHFSEVRRVPLEELLLRIYAAGIYFGDLRGCKSDGCSVSRISCC